MHTPYSELKFGCVLLAAGTGSRMIGVDKLMLEINGHSLIEKNYRLYTDLSLDPVVVTGFAHERVKLLLEKYNPHLVHNDRFLEGQHLSVLTGLNALQDGNDAVIIALADMPLLTKADIWKLMAAYTAKPTHCSAVVPLHDVKRGNPVVIDASLIPAILQSGLGVRFYLDQNPDQIHWYCSDSSGYYVDLDTTDDLEMLDEIYGIRVDRKRHG